MNKPKYIYPNSVIGAVIQDIYLANDVEEAKKIMVDLLQKHNIKNEDKNRMLLNLNNLNTLNKVQRYATNSMLKFEGLGIPK